jgi:hypothetical protein
MGISPLPTPMQRDNQKSGRAMQKLEESGQRGSFHFRDNFENMLRFQGVIVEDLLDKVIDTDRETGMQEADGTAKMTRVNIAGDASTSLKGTYQPTVSTGPDFDSEREEASGFVDTIVSNIATVAQIAGPKPAAAVLAKSIKLKNLGAIGEQIADIIEPPEFKQQDGQQPLPPQARAKLMQQQQQLEQAGHLIQQAQMEKQADTVKQNGQFKIEEMKADKQGTLQIRLQMMKDATTIRAALITAGKERESEQAAAIYDAIALNKELAHEAAQGQLDRLHALETAALGHQQKLEQGEAATAGVLAQQENAAALAPEPQPETGA